MTPSMPNLPGPWFSGMKGTQLSGFTYFAANATNSTITVTLIATMIEFTNADWVIPT